jgi:hypothetical protein
VSVVTEILEKSKEYGREFVLLLIVLSASGIGLKIVFESLNVRIIQQNERIDANEVFIRTQLMVNNDRIASALSASNDVIRANTAALERNSDALRELQRMDQGGRDE